MRTIVIEDELLSRELIVSFVRSHSELEYIGATGSICEGIILINACEPDLVLLDIHLSDGYSFEILDQLRCKPKIIFITSYEEFALKAIKVGALDYILKPILQEEFDLAIQKATSEPQLEEQFTEAKGALLQGAFQRIILKTIEGIHVVNTEEIVYCQSNGSYTQFFLSDKRTILISKNIKEYEELLPQEYFIRCHNSFIVNTREIIRVDKDNNVILRDGKSIPVSSRKKDDLLVRLMR